VTLLGPSGCGKTTTLSSSRPWRCERRRLLSAAARHDLTRSSRRRHGVPELCPLSAHDGGRNIRFTLRCGRVRVKRCASAVAAVAESLELGPYSPGFRPAVGRPSSSVWRSGARSSVSRNCFCSNEPFSNLDPALRIKMRAEVKELHQRSAGHLESS